MRLLVLEEKMGIEEVARKFKVKKVLPEKAWYLEVTNDLRVMIVTNDVLEFDPIIKINNISEESLSFVTELEREYNLKFEDLQLFNTPTIKAIRCASGISHSSECEPILLALFDLSGIIFREIFTFGTETLTPEKIIRDNAEVCEVQDTDILLQAARYILKSQEQ